MSVRSLIGLLALNLLYLGCGTGLVWAVRGYAERLEAVRLAGLAYISGAAVLGTAWTLAVIVGLPLAPWLMLLSAVALLGACAVAGRALGRPLPARGGPRSIGRGTLVGAAGVAATGVFFEGLFRSARLSGLYSFDGWAFWVPKAKALYYFRGLDEQLFTSLPGASYPPLLPVLDAAAFHAMGAPDVVTLHVQFWFFALGFVAAVAGLLSGKVPAWILWPLLVLLLVVPRVSGRLTTPQADFLVDELIVVATVLVALWLQDGGRWRLALAVPLLGAAVLTKREGVLLAACLLASALLVCARRARATWPPLLALAAVVAAIGIPWRIWYVTHGIGGEAPPSGDGASLDRVWPSLRLALDVLFDDGRWSVIAPLAVAAVLLAALARAWAPALFFGVLLVLVTLGGGWITWSYTELPITSDESVNPIVRYTGAAVLLAGVATMLLLAAVWERLAPDREQA